MTRVLFLTESFHPVLGGGETHIRALGTRLVAAGVPATVVTRRGEPGLARSEDRRRDPGRSRASGRARRAPGSTRWFPRALRTLWREREAFDVLVVRGTRVLGLPGLVAARVLGKPVVLQAEINGEMSGEAYTWGTRFARGPGARLVAAPRRRAEPR